MTALAKCGRLGSSEVLICPPPHCMPVPWEEGITTEMRDAPGEDHWEGVRRYILPLHDEERIPIDGNFRYLPKLLGLEENMQMASSQMSQWWQTQAHRHEEQVSKYMVCLITASSVFPGEHSCWWRGGGLGT